MMPETYRARLVNPDGSTAALIERELVGGTPEATLELHEQRTAETLAVVVFTLGSSTWNPGQEAVYTYSSGR